MLGGSLLEFPGEGIWLEGRSPEGVERFKVSSRKSGRAGVAGDRGMMRVEREEWSRRSKIKGFK